MKFILKVLIIMYVFIGDKNKRKFDDGKFLYEFSIAENNEEVRLNSEVVFFWYKNEKIISSVNGFNGKVLNGIYTKSILSNGSIIEKGEFKNGRKHKQWKKWNKAGRLNSLTTWDRGFKNGEFILYGDDSKVILKGKYIKNKKNGKWITLSKEKKELTNWKKDNKHGLHEEYDLNENIILKGYYKHGVKDGIWYLYKKNKKIKYKKGVIIDENYKTYWDKKREAKNKS